MPSRKPTAPLIPPAKIKRDARTLSELAAKPAKAQPTKGRRSPNK